MFLFFYFSLKAGLDDQATLSWWFGLVVEFKPLVLVEASAIQNTSKPIHRVEGSGTVETVQTRCTQVSVVVVFLSGG